MIFGQYSVSHVQLLFLLIDRMTVQSGFYQAQSLQREDYIPSEPEREAMEEYINNSLAAGVIRPSSSPAGAGFFFVGKRDGSLCPCIDYRGLNVITVKNRYPLLLISSAFELLQGARVFSKLDLRNAYHLQVRVLEGNEWKTAFNTPISHYEYLLLNT